MRSQIVSPARTIAKILTLVLAALGGASALQVTPSVAALKAGTASKTGACAIIVTPSSLSAPSAGKDFQVSVSDLQLCQWVATPSVSWIDVSPNTGAMPLTFVTVSVSPNIGPARSGTVNIGGAILSVSQAAGACTYSFDKTSLNLAGSEAVTDAFLNVTASNPPCPRTPATNVNWIVILNGASGTGNGAIEYKVNVNDGPARTGKITLGNATFTVNQGANCYSSISPTSAQIPAAGASGSVGVDMSSSACGAFVQSLVPWITASQVTSGKVNYKVDPNPGPQRDGIISIAGKTFQITQAGGCDYKLSPSIFNFQPGNGASSIQVTASSSFCAWSPASGAPWVKITSASQMKGDGTVNFTVDPNPGANRATSITVGSKTATINQFGSNCSFSINPGAQNFGVNGGEVNVNITASSSSCAWSANASPPFLSVVGGASGVGNGVAKIKVQSNSGAARSGTAVVAGQTFSVTQDGVSASALAITSLSPGFAAKGGKDFSLSVKGANFVGGCLVRWNGADRPTTFVNNTTLLATIPANDTAAEGAFDVKVYNPNGGAESNVHTFMVYGAAAHLSSASFLGGPQSPASLVSAFGIDLATDLKVANSLPLPTELAGSTVTITDAMGKDRQAQLLFVSSGQINYLMPEDVALGKSTVTVKSGGGHTSVSELEIAQVAPALFTANSTGQGLAAATVLRVKANGQQVYEPVAEYDAAAGIFKAKPIDLTVAGEQVYLIFYGSGFRYRSALSAVSLAAGGSPINALYAGVTPGFAGLDQINALAPISLAGRGEVDVVLTVDGKKTNTVKLTFK